MKYKAIIFDMDGTIIDTEQIWHHATRTVITRRGVTITPELDVELDHRLQGMALPQSCQIIKEITRTTDPLEQIMSEKSRLACELYETHVTFIPGFEEFHAQVCSRNMPTGLATNADDLTVSTTDRVLNLRRFFGNHIYNISHVNNMGKPNPALYLLAAKQLGIDPRYCIAIEDSAHGITAAKVAGMTCIGINTAKRPEQIKHADIQIDGYAELNVDDLLQSI